jgi:hypothetical protein
MKTLSLVLFFTFLFVVSYAQNDDKRDYIWVLGAPTGWPTYEFGGAYVNFASTPPDTQYFDIRHYLQALTVVCDEAGHLACYSNSCEVVNAQEQTISNGDDISAGSIHDDYCDLTGYPLFQPALLLPYPGHQDEYMLFHHLFEYVDGIPRITRFLYSHIDMKAEGGEGKVLVKNQNLSVGTNLGGHVTATRHGNGRDWWVVIPTENGLKYFTYLLSPAGIEGPFTKTPYTTVQERWSAGQITFSPDGTWYGELLGESQFRLMQFDRCSGEFYNAQTYDFQGDTIYAGGVTFSPNSRFLYLSVVDKIYQYDLQAPDLQASRLLVAEYDGFTFNNIATTFFQGMLCPDNRIYLTATNSTWFLHVIESPDSLGVACAVNQHSFALPTTHSFSIPNFPFYRLYDLPGSICDSLGIDGPVNSVGQVSISPYMPLQAVPNPTTGLARLAGLPPDAGPLRLTLVDALGRTAAERSSPDGSFDTTGLPAGLYVVLVRDGRGRAWRVRVAVQ